jgi:cytochrome b
MSKSIQCLHSVLIFKEGFMMSNVIRVWDPLVRIFHWGLVLAFVVAYLSGDEENSVHISTFIYSPRAVIGYLKGLLAGRPKHYTGHNPAGGWMIMALLVTLAVVTVSGLKVYAIEEGLGPLAGDVPSMSLISQAHADSDDDDDDHGKHNKGRHKEAEEEFWEEIHEASSNFMLLLIVLHVAGVLVAGRLHGESLVKAMITGKKTDITGS